MNQETKTTITVRFWNNEIPESEWTPAIGSQLDEIGLERAIAMMRDGYTSGELHHEVGGITYDGWFEINTQLA